MRQRLSIALVLSCCATTLGGGGLSLSGLPWYTKRVVMNVGSNLQPVLPPENDLNTSAIAFEPIVYCEIPVKHPRLYVVKAAVSDADGLTTMSVYNQDALSSSLSAAEDSTWNKADRVMQTPPVIVPVISMQNVLSSVPPHIDIWLLKTDMQGFDASAIKAGGDMLSRIHYVHAETYLLGAHPYKTAPGNSFCKDLLPTLTAKGFAPVGLYREGGIDEAEFERLKSDKMPSGGKFLFKVFTGAKYNKKHLDEGTQEAQKFCEREKVFMEERKAAGKVEAKKKLNEADAFFVRIDTKLPRPVSAGANATHAISDHHGMWFERHLADRR